MRKKCLRQTRQLRKFPTKECLDGSNVCLPYLSFFAAHSPRSLKASYNKLKPHTLNLYSNKTLQQARSAISRVGGFCALRFYLCIYRYGSSLSAYSTRRRTLAAVSSDNKFNLLYSLLVSPHTNKSTKDNLKFHLTAQLN